MSDLSDIIARLEKATGPDRALDDAICLACGYKIASWTANSQGVRRDPHGNLVGVPNYTASIDAALTLVPDICWAQVQTATRTTLPLAWCHDKHSEDVADPVEAPTPAIALCIAALKARKSAANRESS